MAIMSVFRKPSEAAVKQLLASVQLPFDDITSDHVEHFFGAGTNSNLDGVVDLELFGHVALLRSLAVIASKRGSGLGSRLLTDTEQYAAEHGVRSMYLLTTTAEAFFRHRGYASISRDAAPEAIRGTQEFANICPSSAVLMVKQLPGL